MDELDYWKDETKGRVVLNPREPFLKSRTCRWKGWVFLYVSYDFYTVFTLGADVHPIKTKNTIGELGDPCMRGDKDYYQVSCLNIGWGLLWCLDVRKPDIFQKD